MENIQKFNKLNENGSKFIQVYINGKPYLRYAREKNCYHAGVLYAILKKEFGFECKIRKDRGGDEVPIEKDDNLNYELVGAGRARYISEETIEFYDSSSSYLMGVNLKHLEDVFKDKKIKITEGKKDFFGQLSFLIEFKGDQK